MNPELFKIYSETLAKKLLEKIVQFSAKDVKGNGKFKVVASTEGVDRHGEIVKVSGWDFTNFMKNPVLLLSHSYSGLPIGVVTKIAVEDNQVVADGVFADTETGQEVRKLYDDGILKAVSVGFIVRERDTNNPYVITKAELLELSFVSVPANPDALSLSKVVKLFNKAGVEIGQTNELIPAQKQVMIKTTNLLKFFLTTQKEFNAVLSDMIENCGFVDDLQVEEKEGRVLSKKNRAAIQEAVDAISSVTTLLKGLMDLSESPEDSGKQVANDLVKMLQSVQKPLEQAIRHSKELVQL
ncbi:MAG: hypothetical protein E6R04_11930 [Spirochaetes bacterium]|nr:MAG: hypothetical protein E6R04_11930 [Spirochaetota bacterium]